MPDYNSEASKVWDALRPAIDSEIDQRTRGMVQRRKAKVTTAPSLVTNKIGVTEPYGTEIFIPFVSNLASAVVGDYVWVEFMYGANNSFASMFASADSKDQTVAGNLTVGGVLDVTPRRCYATLASAGWYRAISFNPVSHYDLNGALGFVMDIGVTQQYSTGQNEVHSIKLLSAYNRFVFSDELSDTPATLKIDKIRLTKTSTAEYIDIHYSVNYANNIAVNFDVDTLPTHLGEFKAESLQAVAASPRGETVLTEYTFAENTEAVGTVVGASGFTPDEIDVKRSGRVVYVHFYVQNVSIAANTNTIIGTLSGVPLPKKYIRWLGGGGAHAYDAVTPVYAIIHTNGNISVISPSAISAVNITISYIV